MTFAARTLGSVGSFVPTTVSFTALGTYNDQAIPAGATTAVIEVFGSSGDGGAGRAGCINPVAGGGGGSGSYCKTTLNVSALNGKTFNITVAGRGSGASTTSVAAGTTNPVTGFTTMSTTGGLTGASAASGAGGGAAGTLATGGTDLNQTGNTGGNGTCSGGAGGLGKTGTNGNGGNGGQGGVGAGNAGLTLGQAGRVYIRYT